MALSLWFLGYPEQALQRSQEALASADLLASPLARTSATVSAAILSQLRGAGREAPQQAEMAVALATTHGFAFWLALGRQVHGWAVAAQSQGAERLAQIHQSLALIQATGSGRLLRPLLVVLLAEAYGQAGQVQEGLTLLTEALTSAHTSGACLYEAELYRLKGELLLQHAGPHSAPAETCLQRALDVARRQQAKSLELRTALSLCRLWQHQGKCHAARQLLHKTYDWFTEGFGATDLVQARALLDTLP
jgi:predicted ATPase